MIRLDFLIFSIVGLPDSERAFVGVEHRISAAASPTKRSEQSPIFELENASNHYRSSSIFYCDYLIYRKNINIQLPNFMKQV